MNIVTFPLGQLQANCYLLEHEGQALLIDPGDAADFLIEKIRQKNAELVGILATHGHFDHVMAVGELQLSYPNIPLHIHTQDQFLLDRLTSTAEHFLGYKPIVIPIRHRTNLQKGALSIGVFSLEVIETPGHTPGSCCFYFKKEKILFTGDTLFRGAIGRNNYVYSDPKKLEQSVQHLLSLPKDTVVYPGHGEETMIGE
ncbi:MBL fold metallo-hydrolase [Candidatus Woesebacteria bacterium]|nr:MBL fold metallo-hydrolase [Candidatus Woesebacteria bacterium]